MSFAEDRVRCQTPITDASNTTPQQPWLWNAMRWLNDTVLSHVFSLTFGSFLLYRGAQPLVATRPLPPLAEVESDEVPHQPCLTQAHSNQAINSGIRVKQKTTKLPFLYHLLHISPSLPTHLSATTHCMHIPRVVVRACTTAQRQRRAPKHFPVWHQRQLTEGCGRASSQVT